MKIDTLLSTMQIALCLKHLNKYLGTLKSPSLVYFRLNRLSNGVDVIAKFQKATPRINDSGSYRYR
jgi:hypothetical protein